MNSGRADPFADDDLSDFQAKPATRPKVSAADVREVSEKHRFLSRAGKRSSSKKPEQRRWRTGRNIQMNIKMTADFKERFEAQADRLTLGLAEAFEKAIEALETASLKSK